MRTTQELRLLLTELINAWPDGQLNPVIEEARQYLQLNDIGYSDIRTLETQEHLSLEDFSSELWYSL